MRERRHREDAPWPGSVATNCVSCYRRWPCEGFQAEEYIAALEAALAAIRAEVEPVRTRRVRRNGTIKALCDAVLATDTAKAWLVESESEALG